MILTSYMASGKCYQFIEDYLKVVIMNMDSSNLAFSNLRYLKSVVRQREEAIKEAERRLATAKKNYERALNVAVIPGVSQKQLRDIMGS